MANRRPTLIKSPATKLNRQKWRAMDKGYKRLVGQGRLNPSRLKKPEKPAARPKG